MRSETRFVVFAGTVLVAASYPCRLVPAAVPSGFATMRFENCAERRPKLLDAESGAAPRGGPDPSAGDAP
jgi:hypothetical protein